MSAGNPGRTSMSVLIIKLGATGDVVRTTSVLRRLTGHVTWITAAKNTALLENLRDNLRCLSWEQREKAKDRSYELVINLEDTTDVGSYLNEIKHARVFGAYLGADSQLRYSDDSRRWFDLSLISVHGKKEADRLKAANRQTYQELIFGGLGFEFAGDKYVLPPPVPTDLQGDVAIAPEGGPVWPMKNWAYYDELKRALEARGLKVNVLPIRSSLVEHMSDVCRHRCLVSGDSLPMHLALGTQTKCVTLFTCTSPWEIYDYGLQTKIVSPLLHEFFYMRGQNQRATTAIGVEEVFQAAMSQLDAR
jgi:ADP-heptose:LPS heptosyltransferase